MLLFYQISAWVFLIHMFLYAGFIELYNFGPKILESGYPFFIIMSKVA